jgi:hypothetical protein
LNGDGRVNRDAARFQPEDHGRPIDARVVPVKIALAESTSLKLRQRVEIETLADEHG